MSESNKTNKNKEVAQDQAPSKHPSPASIYSRDEYGLVKSVKYVFNADGSIDWRSMIAKDHLYPNKDWFFARNLYVPDSVDNLDDAQLSIKLVGIKELAKLRGFSSVSYQVIESSPQRAVVCCSIDFIPNFESNYERVRFSSIANATIDNTNGFGAKFLESIAENRAFVRTVRNFLNIHIVGVDEIDSSAKKSSFSAINIDNNKASSDISPQGILKRKLEECMAICSFDDFKDQLREWYKSNLYSNDPEVIKTWSDFKDIPAKECRKLLSCIPAR
jgi:hypothetical protein